MLRTIWSLRALEDSCSTVYAFAANTGILVQNVLKFLLGFGRPSTFLGWESLEDYFTTLRLRPNDQCADAWCCTRQVRAELGENITIGKCISSFRLK